MNSSIEEILAFKTCCSLFRVFDQNLEIHVTNKSDRPVTIVSTFEIVGDQGSVRMDAVTPPGKHQLQPGEIKALYCYMDETVWAASRHMVFHDSDGNQYPVEILH
jgi:hypothetical protein